MQQACYSIMLWSPFILYNFIVLLSTDGARILETEYLEKERTLNIHMYAVNKMYT